MLSFGFVRVCSHRTLRPKSQAVKLIAKKTMAAQAERRHHLLGLESAGGAGRAITS
jgi:hypothetical protein